MQAKFVPAGALGKFLETALSGRTVYGTRTIDEHVRLSQTAAAGAEINGTRAVEPLKSLFFKLRQDVGKHFEEEAAPGPEPRAVVGAMACDLASLKVLDRVFLEGDFVDPFYKALRENTLVVSCDCTEPKEVCFCTFVGGKPYAEGGYDLNLSPVEGGYVVEAGSASGEAVLKKSGAGLADATKAQQDEAASRRKRVEESVDKQAKEFGLTSAEGLEEKVRRSRRGDIWKNLAEKCVECAACNFVCPTCHCFLLVDLQDKHGFQRFRNWDACLYPAFAREASGANPRARRAERLYGRVEKKFDFIKVNFDCWGCVGCGRCVEACAGDIDLRETLRELANAQPVSAH